MHRSEEKRTEQKVYWLKPCSFVVKYIINIYIVDMIELYIYRYATT